MQGIKTSLVAQTVKRLPAMQETRVPSLGVGKLPNLSCLPFCVSKMEILLLYWAYWEN